MIFGKIWRAIKAQFNKLANFFWTADPIAQMQYEYDLAVEQLKEGREGLEQYRGARRARLAPGRDDEEARGAARRQGQGLPEGRRPRDGGQLRARAQEGARRAGRERAAARDAREGLREQPPEDQARRQEAREGPREDPEVRRRAEDEPRRGGDGQALARASTSTSRRTSGRSSRSSRTRSASTGPRPAWPRTCPARASRTSSARRPWSRPWPRTRCASSRSTWASSRRRPRRSPRRPKQLGQAKTKETEG